MRRLVRPGETKQKTLTPKERKKLRHSLYLHQAQNRQRNINYYRAKLLLSITPEELIFKSYLDNLKIIYTEQKIFFAPGVTKYGKQYIADFYLPDHKTVVEIDGGHHSHTAQAKKDFSRTKDLIAFSAVNQVIRYTNQSINKTSQNLIQNSLLSILEDKAQNIASVIIDFNSLTGQNTAAGKKIFNPEPWRVARTKKVAKVKKKQKRRKNKQRKKTNNFNFLVTEHKKKIGGIKCGN